MTLTIIDHLYHLYRHDNHQNPNSDFMRMNNLYYFQDFLASRNLDIISKAAALK